MLFATYYTSSGELIGVTETSPTPTMDTCTIAISGESVDTSTWDKTLRRFRTDLVGIDQWHITKRAFWNRLPGSNEIALRAVMLQGSPVLLAAGIEKLRARVESSPFVDLKLADTVLGVQWLASPLVPANITVDGTTLPIRLTSEQANAILNTPAGAHELHVGA